MIFIIMSAEYSKKKIFANYAIKKKNRNITYKLQSTNLVYYTILLLKFNFVTYIYKDTWNERDINVNG